MKHSFIKEGDKMNIGIIGGGSIGLLMSSYLVNQHDVTLYTHRTAQEINLRKKGLHLQVNSKKAYHRSINANHISDLASHDILFVCVKQPHLQSLLPYLTSVDENTPIVFTQNGMGHIEQIRDLPNPIYIGIVEHGANRINDVTVNHLGQGKIKIGAYQDKKGQLIDIIRQLDQAPFPFEYAANWQKLLKEKLIVNAVINPLTAIFNVENGALIENVYIKKLAQAICEEVAEALQLDFKSSWENIQAIAKNTKNNTSSMRADILQNRPTEIESIIGYVLQEGKRKLPSTTFVYYSILAKSN